MSEGMPISRADLVAFLRQIPLLTIATVSAEGLPEAALVCAAVGDDLDVVIDTTDDSRKFRNLRSNTHVAMVFGSAGRYILGRHDERTLQYEGIAEIPTGDELKRAQTLYFEAFPEGRDRLTRPHITYLRIRPSWIRFSDYNQGPPAIAELAGEDLHRWRTNA